MDESILPHFKVQLSSYNCRLLYTLSTGAMEQSGALVGRSSKIEKSGEYNI